MSGDEAANKHMEPKVEQGKKGADKVDVGGRRSEARGKMSGSIYGLMWKEKPNKCRKPKIERGKKGAGKIRGRGDEERKSGKVEVSVPGDERGHLAINVERRRTKVR